jgi:hypothetical protein
LGARRNQGIAGALHPEKASSPGVRTGDFSAVALPPISVRLLATGRVACGTAYFYSKLRVSSLFGSFEVTLPTCPDQFFVPR